MKNLKIWIVPNDKIQLFCNCPYWCEDYYIDSIMKHDEKNYSVVSNGSYPFVSGELLEILQEGDD